MQTPRKSLFHNLSFKRKDAKPQTPEAPDVTSLSLKKDVKDSSSPSHARSSFITTSSTGMLPSLVATLRMKKENINHAFSGSPQFLGNNDVAKSHSSLQKSQSALNDNKVPDVPALSDKEKLEIAVADKAPEKSPDHKTKPLGFLGSRSKSKSNRSSTLQFAEKETLNQSLSQNLDPSVAANAGTQGYTGRISVTSKSSSVASLTSEVTPAAPPMPMNAKALVSGAKLEFLKQPHPPTTNLDSPEPGILSKIHKSMPKIAQFVRKSRGKAVSDIPPPTQPPISNSNIGTNGNTQLGQGISVSNLLAIKDVVDKRQAGLSAYEISNTPVARRYRLDDFHIVRRAGKGGFATVFLVRLKAASGKYFALKAIKKIDVIKSKQEKQIVNEKIILQAIKHNFIVELYHTFQDTYHLYMVMEYIDGGDLYSYLRRVQKFGDEDSKFYAAEVLIALQYLHSENIIFRDLKPENILLDTTGHTKLADFGFAKVVIGTTQSFCGTPDYIAREIVRNHSYTKSVDWWSFGVLIFELVSGKTPFSSNTSEGIYNNISDCRIQWNQSVKSHCKDIVSRLLDRDPERRLGSNGDGDEIRAHPWFKTVRWTKAEMRQLMPPFLPACDSPEAIEKERAARGNTEDYATILKNGGVGTVDHGPLFATGDPFSDVFKSF